MHWKLLIDLIGHSFLIWNNRRSSQRSFFTEILKYGYASPFIFLLYVFPIVRWWPSQSGHLNCSVIAIDSTSEKCKYCNKILQFIIAYRLFTSINITEYLARIDENETSPMKCCIIFCTLWRGMLSNIDEWKKPVYEYKLIRFIAQTFAFFS